MNDNYMVFYRSTEYIHKLMLTSFMITKPKYISHIKWQNLIGRLFYIFDCNIAEIELPGDFIVEDNTGNKQETELMEDVKEKEEQVNESSEEASISSSQDTEKNGSAEEASGGAPEAGGTYAGKRWK